MLSKSIIIPSQHETEEYVSPIFITPKRDGTFRLILNLKKLNEYVTYEHFKMESIHSVAYCISPNCYMAKIDLKDAYYSVGIHPDYQKFLKFEWDGQLYQYVCYPNGLSSCPRKFTKLFKPVLAQLRIMAIVIAGYLDDFFTCSDSYISCLHNMNRIKKMFSELGFVVHPSKSSIVPSQQIEFLGFNLNSITMTISLTTEKRHRLNELIQILLSTPLLTIQFVGKVLGTMISSFPASKYGPL